MIVQKLTHVVEGLGRLISQYVGSVHLRGLLGSYLAQIQDLENAAFPVGQILQNISGQSGAQLDLIGKLIALPRGGLSDAQYRVWLQAQLLTLRSSGTPDQLMAIGALLIPPVVVGPLTVGWSNFLYPPASFVLYPPAPTLLAAQIAALLSNARTGGVNGQMLYSQKLDANTFVFSPDDTEHSGIDQAWCTVPGIDWANESVGGGYTGSLNGAVWAEEIGLWVTVGATGGIQTSPDGGTWTKRMADAGYAGDFEAVTWNGSIFVAVGTSGEIQTSPDGVTWTHRSSTTGVIFRGVAYAAGQFIAVGEHSGPVIRTSPDGITWTAQSAAVGFNGSFYCVAFGGAQWLIGGSGGELETSPDGITWTTQAAAGGYSGIFTGLVYSQALGRWIAVGDSNEIETSPDAVTWTQRPVDHGFAGDFHGVALSSTWGLLVAVGDSMEIQTSSDGIAWVHQTPASPSAHTLNAIAADAEGGFVTTSSAQEIEVSALPGGVWADVEQL